jgi:hypothetical protein
MIFLRGHSRRFERKVRFDLTNGLSCDIFRHCGLCLYIEDEVGHSDERDPKLRDVSTVVVSLSANSR